MKLFVQEIPLEPVFFQVLHLNEPTYDKVLTQLDSNFDLIDSRELPGTTSSVDRFIRATFYTKNLPQPISNAHAIHNLFSVLDNISQPAGIASSERTTISTTIWKTISDLSHRVYYFDSAKNFNVIQVSLAKFNLLPGNPVMKLDLSRDLLGDVTNEFRSVIGSSSVQQFNDQNFVG